MEALETILSDVLPISWDFSDRPHTTNADSRRLPLALLEAFIVVGSKLQTIGSHLNIAYPNGVTLRPNSSKGFEGEVAWQTCEHKIDVGYSMNPESITHELGHEFDCQHGTHEGTNLLMQVNHFIYNRQPYDYRYGSEETCDNRTSGQRRTLTRDDVEGGGQCIHNSDVRLCVGDVFCFLSGNTAAAREAFVNIDAGFGARLARQGDLNLPQEVWADMFMNWVYTSPFQPYVVNSVGFQNASNARAAAARYEWMTRKMRQVL